MTQTMKIKTKRLLLRPLELKDAESIAENANNLNVSKWLLTMPYPYSLRSAKSWISKSGKKKKEKPRKDYSFGIELREEKRIIGGVGLHKVDRYQGRGEVGYWLGEKYWRKGYGSEALEAIINLAFNRLKLRKLEAGVFAGNPSSGKLLESFGFKQEGYKREACRCKANDKICNEYIYGLLKREYKPKR